MEISKERFAKSLLAEVGASGIGTGEGKIPVSHPGTTHRVLGYNEFDKTPAWVVRKNELIGKAMSRARVARDFRLRSFFEKSCIKYIDPNIKYKLIPIRLENIKYHVLSAWLEGDIVNRMENLGKEGKEGETKVYRWQECPSDKSEYDWSKVAGSADLSSAWEHRVYDSQTGAFLGEVNQNTKADVGDIVSVDAHWKSGSLFDLIQQVINVLITGGITTQNGYDVTVTYNWKGTNTEEKHVDNRVWVPVSGDLTWIWN